MPGCFLDSSQNIQFKLSKWGQQNTGQTVTWSGNKQGQIHLLHSQMWTFVFYFILDTGKARILDLFFVHLSSDIEYPMNIMLQIRMWKTEINTVINNILITHWI